MEFLSEFETSWEMRKTAENAAENILRLLFQGR